MQHLDSILSSLSNHLISEPLNFGELKRKERKHINFNGLKVFIKNVKNTENQMA